MDIAGTSQQRELCDSFMSRFKLTHKIMKNRRNYSTLGKLTKMKDKNSVSKLMSQYKGIFYTECVDPGQPYELYDELITENINDNSENKTDGLKEMERHTTMWMEYLNSKRGGVLPAINDVLFPRHRKTDKTLLEYLCPTDTIILIYCDDETVKFSKVLTSVGTNIKIEILEADHIEPLWIDYTSIVLDPDEVRKATIDFGLTTEEFEDLYRVEYFAKYSELLHLKFHELISEGMYLEIQANSDPSLVFFAQVIKNFNGILVLRIGEEIKITHMFDPYVHHIGWAREQDPSEDNDDQWVSYSKICYEDDYDDLLANAAPPIAFEENIIKKHDLQIGNVLVVASEDYSCYYYGHVEHILDSHFFILRIGKTDTYLQRTPLHINSPNILPVAYAENIPIQIQFPTKIRSCWARREFDWGTYNLVHGSKSAKNKAVKKCGVVDDVNDFRDFKINTLRYIEYLDIQEEQICFLAAEILRSEKDHIWIHVHSTKSVYIVPYSDTRLYPCGTAAKLGIPIRYELECLELSNEENDSSSSEDCDFRRAANLIFSNSKTCDVFMPQYIEKDDIVPRIYVNRGCYFGTMLDKKKVMKLPNFFESGCQTGVLRLIYKNLMMCARTAKRQTVHHILQRSVESDRLVPVIYTKYRKNLGECTQILRAISCDFAKYMPDYLKVILLAIGACPNVLTLQKPKRKCNYGCVRSLIARKERRAAHRFIENKLLSKRGDKKINISVHKKINSIKDNRPKIIVRKPNGAEKINTHSQSNVKEKLEPQEQISEVSTTSEQGEKSKDCGLSLESNSKMPVINVPKKEVKEELKEETPGPVLANFDDIFGGHRRSLEERMERVFASGSLLLTPLPRKIENQQMNQRTPDKVTEKKIPMGVLSRTPDMRLTTRAPHLKTTTTSPAKLPSKTPQNQAQPHMVPPNMMVPTQMFNQMGHPVSNFGYPMFTPMSPGVMPMMNQPDAMMNQQLVNQFQMIMQMQMNYQKHMQNQQQPQQLTRSVRAPESEKKYQVADRTKVVPTRQSLPSTSSSQSTSSPAMGAARNKSTSPKDLTRMEKPTLETFISWNNAELTEFIKKNMYFMGVDAVKAVEQKKLTGAQLVDLTKEQCICITNSFLSGTNLHRFIGWVKKG